MRPMEQGYDRVHRFIPGLSLNSDTRRRELFDANRITAGINLGFSTKLVRSEVRLNYEKYLLKERPSDFAVNKLLHDKFTLEIVASF